MSRPGILRRRVLSKSRAPSTCKLLTRVKAVSFGRNCRIGYTSQVPGDTVPPIQHGELRVEIESMNFIIMLQKKDTFPPG